MPVISVIMGVYNQTNEEQLMQAVDSVLKQSFRDLELLIFDDGSGEEGRQLLERIAERDLRIRLLGESRNHGLAYALNGCIAEASGKYLARMDADDICLPERLARQYEYLENHPETAFVGSGAKLIDDDGIWGERKMREEPQPADYIKYSPFIHPTVMFRTEVLRREGGYLVSEETRRCEDYELFLRLYLGGYRAYNLPEQLLCYREDRAAYRRRTVRDRICEMKLRGRYFSRLPVSRLQRIAGVLRPVFAGLVPAGVIRSVRRLAEGTKRQKVPGQRDESWNRTT